MVFYIARDEEVTVVVAGAAVDLDLDTGLLAGGFEQLGFELVDQEVIGLALFDKDLSFPAFALYQFACVVPCPLAPVFTEVTS